MPSHEEPGHDRYADEEDGRAERVGGKVALLAGRFWRCGLRGRGLRRDDGRRCCAALVGGDGGGGRVADERDDLQAGVLAIGGAEAADGDDVLVAEQGCDVGVDGGDGAGRRRTVLALRRGRQRLQVARVGRGAEADGEVRDTGAPRRGEGAIRRCL